MSETSQELARLVRLLVDKPEAVEVSEARNDRGVLFQISVSPDDLGKVIGRQGRTARALRTLLSERGTLDGESYELEILED